MSVKVSMTVNGKAVAAEVEERTLLVNFIRDELRLTGTHVGCDTAQCGACTIHMNGNAVKSCSMLAAQAAYSLMPEPIGSEMSPPSRASTCTRGARSGRLSRIAARWPRVIV